VTQTVNWSSFSADTFSPSAGGFAGATFDGRYAYFVPTGNISASAVVRYDTSSAFTTAASWSTFDAPAWNANAQGFLGGALDGRYVYYVANENVTGYDGLVARYATQAAFGAAASWSTFDAAP
jgi:hypothetical protein